MHERSLARQLLEAVMARREGGEVVRVSGWLAESEALSAESLRLHFADLAAGGPAAGARLELRLEHIRARCGGCGAEYLPEHHLTICTACGSVEGELLGTPGLGIEAIEVR